MSKGDLDGNEICDVSNIADLNENMQSEDLSLLFQENELTKRPSKRIRDDEEEDWSVIRSRKQRLQDLRGAMELCITSNEIFPKQFAFAKLLKKLDITNITKVKYINPYKVIIEFSDRENAEKFATCKELVDKGWKFHRPYEVSLSYGVIKNIEIDLSEKELMESITCPSEVVYLRRLKRRNKTETGWIESETVRLGFKGSSLPSHVSIYGMRVNVQPYVFPVTQCSRCWRFGHTHKLCPSKKVVCPKCGGKHENCEITSFKCVNCTDKHMALDKSCPIFKKEKKIRDIMAELNVTYRKAREMYVPPTEETKEFYPSVSSSPILPLEKVAGRQASYSSVVQIDPKIKPTKTYHNQKTSNLSNHTAQQDKNKNQKKKKNKPNLMWDLQNEEESIDQECEEDENKNDNNKEDECGSQKSDSFKRLLERLKEMVLAKGMNMHEKIIYIVKTCIEWLCVMLVSIIPKDFSFWGKIFNYG